jgi:predicted nucleic acid-binding protein
VEAEVILVDTNAWIHHLRRKDARLVGFLLQQRVHTCEIVVGELLLGSGLPKTFAADLLALPRLPSPSAVETRTFIERHRRMFAGSGVGWADAQIVLAATKSGARVHTSDGNVRRVCRAIGVALA